MSLAERVKARQAAGEKFDFETARAARADQRAAAAGTASAETPDRDPAAAMARPGGSPAQRHRLRIIAASQGRVLASKGLRVRTDAANEDRPESTEEANMLIQLRDHKRSLKSIQSVVTKIELKREILPLYSAWIDGVLQGDSGRQDEILATVLVWRIDVGDVLGALPLAEYVLRHKLDLPANIARTPATFITEDIAEAALKAYAAGLDQATAFPEAALLELEDLVADEDMPDEVRAKLNKAIAAAALASGDETNERTRQELALQRYQRALQLDSGAGVKKDIEALKRQLKKTGEGDSTPAPETTTPPPSEGG